MPEDLPRALKICGHVTDVPMDLGVDILMIHIYKLFNKHFNILLLSHLAENLVFLHKLKNLLKMKYFQI